MIIDYYEKGEMFVHKKDDLHEANLLMLNIEKAEKVLGWTPTFTANEAIKETVEWYKRFYNGQNVIDFTFSQIDKYQKKINFKDKQNETIINTIN
jgi:CDP-glucose 4,6-dehydratase